MLKDDLGLDVRRVNVCVMGGEGKGIMPGSCPSLPPLRRIDMDYIESSQVNPYNRYWEEISDSISVFKRGSGGRGQKSKREGKNLNLWTPHTKPIFSPKNWMPTLHMIVFNITNLHPINDGLSSGDDMNFNILALLEFICFNSKQS